MSNLPTMVLSAPGPAAAAGPPPRKSRLRVGLATTGLVLCCAVILWATLSPTPLDQGYEGAIDRLLAILHRNGIPEWFGYNKLEFLANVAMFVPFGFLIALALPKRFIWLAFLFVPAFSGAVELVQALALSARFATIMDVFANSLGGYVGAIVAILIRTAVSARDKKVIARAVWERAACSS